MAMKSYGMVIDESLQPQNSHHHIKLSSPSQSLHTKKRLNFDNNTESYSTVVEQAITTKDKPLLKEIISDSDDNISKNTISGLTFEKISSLLNLLQEFLYDDCRNTDRYCFWLRELLKQHIGVILSNGENKSIVSRLIRFIQRKKNERDALFELKIQLSGQQAKKEIKEFIPKFSYIQSQIKQGQEEKGEEMIDEEEFNQEDLMMDDFQE